MKLIIVCFIDVHEGYAQGTNGMTGAQGYAASSTQAAGTAEGAQGLNIIEENLQVGSAWNKPVAPAFAAASSRSPWRRT